MTDATILIPTHNHAPLLPYAIRSALAQEGSSIELFVIGDGVGDDTREAVEPFLVDKRVRFFDNPKGERHGELHRHAALQEAAGEIVCYLGDDDLLLRDHVATLLRVLADVDLAHSAPAFVSADRELVFLPMDIARPEFRDLLLAADVSFSLTGAAHTLDAYRRLPVGWRPAPPDIWTDLFMWQQFVRAPGFTTATSARLTHLHFPSPVRTDWSVEERVAELEHWERRIAEPGLRSAVEAELRQAVIIAGENHRMVAISCGHIRDDLERRQRQGERERAALALQLETLRETRTFRLRERLIRLRPLRALLARSPGGR